MLLLELLLGLIRFLLGAALFSFMNVVAWRLPRGMDPLKGRSVCPQCGHTLGAPDLVPVFSWLFLRGRCRHCGAHIPARYLLVELLGGVLALGCTWRYGAAYALPGGLFGMSWAALLALAVPTLLHGLWDFLLAAGSRWAVIAFYAFVAVFFITADVCLRRASRTDSRL